MNPEPPNPSRDEIEARITALLLGELPESEAALLRWTIEHDTELAKLHARLKRTIELTREVSTTPAEATASPAEPLNLSSERREKLLAQFKIITPKESVWNKPIELSKLVRIAAVLAILALLAVMLLPALSPAKRKTQRASSMALAKQTEIEQSRTKDTVPTSSDDAQYRYFSSSLENARFSEKIAGEKTRRETPSVTPPVESHRYANNIVLPTPTTEVDATSRLKSGDTVSPTTTRDDVSGLRYMYSDNGATPAAAPAQTLSPQLGRTMTTIAGREKSVDLGVNAADENTLAASGTPTPATTWGSFDGVANDSIVYAAGSDISESLAKLDAARGGGRSETGSAQPNVGAKFSTVAPNDNRALGFDWYSGYQIDAQDGATPSEKPQLSQSGQGKLASGEANNFSGGTVVNAGRFALVPPQSGEESLPQNKTLDDFLMSQADSMHSKQGNAGLINGSVQQNSTNLFQDKLAHIINRAATDQLALQTTDLGAPHDRGEEYRARRVSAATDNTSFESSSLRPTLDYEIVAQAQNALNDFEVRYAEKATTLNALRGLNREELRTVLPRAVGPDDQLKSLEDQLNTLKQNDGPYQTKQQAIQNLDKQIDKRIGEIIAIQETQLASLKTTVDASKANVDAAKHADIRRAEEVRPYYAAKERLERLTDAARLLDMHIFQTSVDTSIPKTAAISIVERAAPQTESNPTLWERITGRQNQFESTARIRVTRDQPDIAGMADQQQSFTSDSYFIKNEFEAIKSDAVLDKVAEKLDLKHVWANKYGGGHELAASEVRELLKKRIQLRAVPKTTLIDIDVKADQPEETAEIANAVAETYHDNRREERRRLSSSGLDVLKEERAAINLKIAQAETEVERLRKLYNIGGENSSNGEPTLVVPRKPATNAPIPQPEMLTLENNFSTFSLNVSDVSFKLAAASLEKGQMPDAASIRSEEFINAFDYRDPEAPPGVPVAFASERARYPFAHNRDLLRFSIKTAAAGRQAGHPLNLVLLLDNSGSMERADRVAIIREALRVLAAQLQPQDKISIITFARTPRLWVDGVSGDKAGESLDQIGGITPEGGTNLEEAMNLAYRTAFRHYLANGANRVVLLTDGAANLGNVEPEALKQKVESFRKQGIALDCFGIGWEGYNDDLLEQLSSNGDGRYGFINTPEEAATGFAGQLAGALKVAASDVKVQVEFNPKRVISYRQIGYAKHQLTKEQFRDNTVDAAEIAAQEAGNALYTIETNPSGDGSIATVRVRYKIPGTADYREQSWDVPYTGNAVALDQSSAAMRLAATASAFSEWLAASPFAQEVTPDALLKVLSGVPEVYGADSRPTKLEWMIRQAKSLAGK